jgi:hypothetical protein
MCDVNKIKHDVNTSIMNTKNIERRERQLSTLRDHWSTGKTAVHTKCPMGNSCFTGERHAKTPRRKRFFARRRHGRFAGRSFHSDGMTSKHAREARFSMP